MPQEPLTPNAAVNSCPEPGAGHMEWSEWKGALNVQFYASVGCLNDSRLSERMV